MEGGNSSYSFLLKRNYTAMQNPNPNTNPFQPFSTYYRANNHGFPLFGSTMANLRDAFIYHPSPNVTVISVPGNVSVVVQSRTKNRLNFMPTTTRVPSGTQLPFTFGQASLPLAGPQSLLFGHCHNGEAPRASNMHAFVDLNNIPPGNTNIEGDNDQEKIAPRTYKCKVCMAVFYSHQAYGGHMSSHSLKRIKPNKYEIGESSRPLKKVKENPIWISGASTSVVDISFYAKKLEEIKRETSNN